MALASIAQVFESPVLESPPAWFARWVAFRGGARWMGYEEVQVVMRHRLPEEE